MKTYRLSASIVDAVEKFALNDEGNVSEMYRYFTDFQPSEFMKFGTRIHEILETSYNIKQSPEFDSGFMEFVREVCPNGVTEHKAVSHPFNLAGVNLVVSGVADIYTVNTVVDHKTTGYFDYNKYSNSVQPYLYCWLFGVRSCWFNVYKTTGAPVKLAADQVPIRFQIYTNSHEKLLLKQRLTMAIELLDEMKLLPFIEVNEDYLKAANFVDVQPL